MRYLFMTPTRLAALANMVDAGNILDAVHVHLYTNAYTPTKDSVLADFTEATYTGYADVAVGAYAAPFVGIDGLPHVEAPHIQFQPSGLVAPEVIEGVFITDTAGSTLIAAARLDTPVPLNSDSDAVVIEPDFIYGS